MNDPLLHAWSRPSLRGNRRWPSSTSGSVGKTLARESLDRPIGASEIIEPGLDPVAVAEIELGQIPLQVGLAHMLLNAIDAALQDGEIAFDGIGVSVVPHVFLGFVVYGQMLGIGPTNVAIDVGLIGHEPAVPVSVANNDWIEIARGHIRT